MDTTDAVPVYAQIVEQAKRAVAAGVISAGEALPSLRETAVKLRVNPLTVGRAYKQLEQEGLIETRHGLGSFVTGDAMRPADEFRRDAIARGIDNVLVDAMGLDARFAVVLAQAERPPGHAHDRRARGRIDLWKPTHIPA